MIIKLIKNINRNDTISLAAETAYYLILSIAPLLMFLVSLLDNVTLSDWYLFEYLLPKSVENILIMIADNLPSNKQGSISILSILISAWAASNAIWALMKGVYKSFTTERLKMMLTARIAAIIFTFAFAFSIIASFSLLVIGKPLTEFIMLLFNFQKWALDLLRTAFAVLAIFLFIVSLYFFTPGYKIKFKYVLPGGVAASLGWIIVSYCFEIYIKNFNKYANIYGGLGAFLALLLWLFVVSLIILIGAEISVLYEEKERGKTIG